ncbi:uncharacterized protein C1orf131 homolog isoform X1 [Tiliqua scincoides]|uniref:uncharacterized protein C1orf131 homolog isoform X1 n=1 Tax=Tiliqua scincoides TaxID=71010 RepID=UPI0034620951
MARSPAEEPESEGEGAASASRLLDTVLSSLYDFGEPLLDGNKKKKCKKRNLQDSEINATNPLPEDRGGMKLKSDSVTQGKRKNPSSFFQSLKDELVRDGIAQKKSVPESNTPDASPPKLAQQGNAAQIEVVTFHGPSRKKKPKPELADSDGSKAKPPVQEKHVDHQEFTLEKARLEVHRFGITGFEKKEQRVLEQERAIMLGAKAPKKEYLNYKILQEQIKRNKAVKKEGTVMEIKSDSQRRRKTKGHKERKPKKKTKHSMLPTGQVGTFKNGTLMLRRSDIKKIKSSKGIN